MALRHIAVAGNIGSGKTTQLDLLERKGWSVKREPIDEWPLDLFYKDKSRWALLLQMKILQVLIGSFHFPLFPALIT